MPRVTVKGPEGRLEHTAELEHGGALLVGRSPNPEGLQATLPDGSSLSRVFEVAVPSVSANHLVAWSERGKLFVKDLSRNGTWLLLPRGQPICMGPADAVLQLARAGVEAPGDEPPTPSWKAQKEFASAVVAAVKRWAPLQSLDLDVRLCRREEAGISTAIPLASGEVLDLVPRTTTDVNWSGLVERLWHWVSRLNALYESEEQTRSEGMVLASSAIRAAHQDVVAAAQRGARSLLLTGPSGAGKEMLAEVFHRHSGRSGPFVAVNCSMFSKELLRSELFGAEPGSFTGATRRIVGAVERAQNGTLFLDEIGDMAPEVQPMLLRFLDRREFENLGKYGNAQRADVCVVAATNKDLRAATRSGKFRTDLWYRLSVQVVDVPPLRARWDDIVAFLETTPMQGGHSLKAALTPAALDLLRAHGWDGNFRELNNLRERLPSDAGVGSIDEEACARALERGALSSIPNASHGESSKASPSDWVELSLRAVRAFVEDRGHEPASWDDQKEWNEKYLKPLLFFHLSGAGAQQQPVDDEALAALASRAAVRLRADRGTALKQLARYFERYRSESKPA